jgi:orotate phosphoribosyltransferase
MSELVDMSKQLAASLLQIGAVTLRPHQPFTWTSGLKSPIYCDNRLTMTYPDIRERIADGFADLVRELYPNVDVIAGTATAGIPHAAWVAQKLSLPMIYVRDKAKGHGKENLIEGLVKSGQKVVVIEDLISTGGSSLKAAAAIKETGAQPLGVLAIFSYQLDRAAEAFKEANTPLHTLSDYSNLLDAALELGHIKEQDVDLLRSWRANPAAFGI